MDTIKQPQPLTKINNILVFTYLLSLILYVLLQANPLFTFPARDSSFFMYAGHKILAGDKLYIDVWDSKGPGIFYLNSLGLFLGGGSRWGIWILEFIVICFFTFLGYYIVSKVLGVIPALGGASASLFLLNSTLQNGNLTEEYSLFFSMLAVLIYWKYTQNNGIIFWPWFSIGVLFGLNFFIRANNIGVFVALFGLTILHAILARGKPNPNLLKIITGAICGFALVSCTIILYFWREGNLHEMVRAAFLYNFYYSGANGGFDVLLTLNVIKQILKGFWYFIPIAYLTALFSKFRPAQKPLIYLALINFPVEGLLASMSGRGYLHYFTNLAFSIFILSAIFVHLILSSLPKNGFAIVDKYIFVFVIGAAFIFSKELEQFNRYYLHPITSALTNNGEDIEKRHPVAEYVREHTQKADTVLVWGIDPLINFLSDRDSPVSTVFYPYLVDSPYSSQLEDDYLKDLIANRPKYIIELTKNKAPELDLDPATNRKNIPSGLYLPSNLPQVITFISKNYMIETVTEKAQIYRLMEP